MEATRDNRQKLMEWLRRYLPNVLAGRVGELGAAAAAYVNTAVGFVVGSVAADIAFYVMAIVSHDRFKGLLAVRSHVSEEVGGGLVPAVAAA